MWIRSQDKNRLVKTSNLRICFEKEICSLSPIANGEEAMRIWLGSYSTKEKALKVLDMIQRFIDNEFLISVFDMPQDDEVEDER